MSDDSFFREVDEEIRHDKVKAVWTRFGAWLLGGAIAVVAVTAGFVAYEHYQTNQANAAGDQFAAAIKLAADGETDAAIKALNGIVQEGVGSYPALARLSIAGIEAKAGKPKEAVAAYDSVANDSGAPTGLRDMAAIRAAYVLVDSGTLDEVRERVERLSGDSEPLRFPAREAIALAAWKAGDADTAKPLLEQLVTDSGTPRDISGRARILLDLINSGATGPDALPPAKAGENAASAPAASADDGLGSVNLPGLLDGTGDASTEGSAGGAAMPTTDLGASSGSDASGAGAPDNSATGDAAAESAGGAASPAASGANDTAPSAADAPAGAAPSGAADAPQTQNDAGSAMPSDQTPATSGGDDAETRQPAADGAASDAASQTSTAAPAAAESSTTTPSANADAPATAIVPASPSGDSESGNATTTGN
ncbi:tetratricopeptide repeat protein [Jiella mangrovi]|uniref:Tetratricopeptide repeat protein n=1 Tax=Jiella mangrovi TaxID=2821407 RepID=A0ABS4BMW3_9HYPH|nr:tetratricopeptide repeat protein [Jiella mangrovi]MBP0617556.1 tetratricopeptide repeat protein [Jiella mangrovi]